MVHDGSAFCLNLSLFPAGIRIQTALNCVFLPMGLRHTCSDPTDDPLDYIGALEVPVRGVVNDYVEALDYGDGSHWTVRLQIGENRAKIERHRVVKATFLWFRPSAPVMTTARTPLSACSCGAVDPAAARA